MKQEDVIMEIINGIREDYPRAIITAITLENDEPGGYAYFVSEGKAYYAIFLGVGIYQEAPEEIAPYILDVAKSYNTVGPLV